TDPEEGRRTTSRQMIVGQSGHPSQKDPDRKRRDHQPADRTSGWEKLASHRLGGTDPLVRKDHQQGKADDQNDCWNQLVLGDLPKRFHDENRSRYGVQGIAVEQKEVESSDQLAVGSNCQ
ncbi:MAG: hypothetical protein ACK5O5_00140, partial [bacterium]